ncbi:MAG TPA: phosphatidylserine decarboxylase [Casimicrobiaceae bacterium]|nr:phosphatidylserine decarboxylase [Casimicrobiaceae bacterium]
MRPGSRRCDADLRKGDELGWFQHGSTLIVLAPAHFGPCGNIAQGAVVRIGQPLLRMHGA